MKKRWTDPNQFLHTANNRSTLAFKTAIQIKLQTDLSFLSSDHVSFSPLFTIFTKLLRIYHIVTTFPLCKITFKTNCSYNLTTGLKVLSPSGIITNAGSLRASSVPINSYISNVPF